MGGPNQPFVLSKPDSRRSSMTQFSYDCVAAIAQSVTKMQRVKSSGTIGLGPFYIDGQELKSPFSLCLRLSR